MRRTLIAGGCAAVLVGAPAAEAARQASEPFRPTWPLSARLLGGNEISTETGRRNAGDRNGRGHASVTGTSTRICVGLAYRGLGEITGAHIHRAKPNRNGPIVVPLATPDDGALGASSSCHDVEPALSRAILRRPNDFYVNVHTTEFPGGAIRGQLKRG